MIHFLIYDTNDLFVFYRYLCFDIYFKRFKGKFLSPPSKFRIQIHNNLIVKFIDTSSTIFFNINLKVDYIARRIPITNQYIAYQYIPILIGSRYQYFIQFRYKLSLENILEHSRIFSRNYPSSWGLFYIFLFFKNENQCLLNIFFISNPRSWKKNATV